MKDERDFSFPLQTFPFRSFWFCKRRVARMCCLRPGTVRVFRNTALMTSCNSTKEKKNSQKDTRFLFCFWFLPNGFQKYPGLIFIGSSRSPDKFDGQLAYRGEPAQGRCGLASSGSDVGLWGEAVRDHKAIITMSMRGPSAASCHREQRRW